MLEDLCADYFKLKASVAAVLASELVHFSPGHAYSAVAKLAKLIGVSEGVALDGSFARQARRNFI